MKPDLSPEDLDGLLLNAARQIEDARHDENDKPPSRLLAGLWLPAGFILAIVMVVLCVRWSLAK